MKEYARDALISAAVGVLIAYLVTIESASGPRWSIVRYGALLGFFAYVFCAGLTYLLRGWLARLPVPGWLSRAVLYFIGGAAAFLLANYVVSALGWIRFRSTFEALRAYVPVAGAIGVLVGLLFYAFGILQGRLTKSIERLKEAEFAEKELELARTIQQRILPPEELSGRGYRVHARNLAAQFVAGDFYDVFQLPDGAVGLVVADVAGKGIGASLIMATVKASLPFLAAGRPVEQTLREANRRLLPRLEAREFVALTYVRYEPGTGAYSLANAGLPDPYLLGRDGKVRAISVPGPRFPLGIRADTEYERIGGVLAPGERLMLLSDGLPEAVTVEGDPLGYPALERILARNSDPDEVFDAVRAATGRSLTDDWTLLVLERTA